MKKAVLFVLMLVPVSCLAREAAIKCKTQSYSVSNDSLTLVCPPHSAFSPIRVTLVVGHIDRGPGEK